MPRLPKILFILFIVVFTLIVPPVYVESLKKAGAAQHAYQVNSVMCMKLLFLVHSIHARKVLVATNDYDYGRANNKHDPPQKGKPGIGGKNP
ncbi:hypothetical protein AXF42_Ash010074 [Apostasia shenzhenica]|uniref:Uncharacterized protein n=1 Tax=Apostasia shenzhenica TaxID=1088818 RepID=A0A2I0ACR7_9ASPA|nr:hypothetical protein AXF42_Ash010074 [Apostasia shenzhenica]